MRRSLGGLLRSPPTRSSSGPPVSSRIDGHADAWHFQGWKWLTTVAVAAGQTAWFVSRGPGGTDVAVGFLVFSLLGVYVVFAGATWVAREFGIFQYERPWVAVPALLAAGVALVAPLLVDDSTGVFVAAYLSLQLVAGGLKFLVE